jgi:hypothetical protein
MDSLRRQPEVIQMSRLRFLSSVDSIKPMAVQRWARDTERSGSSYMLSVHGRLKPYRQAFDMLDAISYLEALLQVTI